MSSNTYCVPCCIGEASDAVAKTDPPGAHTDAGGTVNDYYRVETKIKVEAVNDLHEESELSELLTYADGDITSINMRDQLFNVESEAVEISSSLKTEPFDEVNDSKISTDVKIEAVSTYCRLTSSIDLHEKCEATEDQIEAVDDVTSINVMDHLFKIEREGVETRSSKVKIFINQRDYEASSCCPQLRQQTSLVKTEVDINSDDKVLKSATVLLQPIFIGTCDYCKQLFYSKQVLQMHLLGHALGRAADTAEDNTESTNRCYLNTYPRIKINKEKRKICKISQKGHSFKPMLTHTGEKRFTCGICMKTFKQKSKLNRHMRTHTGEKPFTCEICMKKFSEKCHLNRHKYIHTEEKPFTCGICMKKFIEKGHLNGHMRTHTGEKPFTCGYCMKKYSEKSSLSEHMRTHTGEKQFSCKICKKIFCVQKYLNMHMKTHTGEKPFKCEICMKKYSFKSSVNIHMYIHTGEKPFTCEICKKKFSNKGNFNKHMRTHTGEKPFTCGICNKKFSQKPYLNKHMKTHTEKKTRNL